MTQFWRKRVKNRWAAARYWPQAEALYWRYRRQKLFDPIQDLHERFATNIPDTYPGGKYIHRYGFYLRENIVRGVMLAIHRGRPLRILDIGCGPGYFLHLCRYWGHETLGLDVPGNQIFDKLMDTLALPRLDEPVRALAPLPDAIGRFDLVTAYSIDFDELPLTGQPWGMAAWQFFMSDVGKLLRPGGRLFLRLNLDKYGLQRLQDLPALHHVLTRGASFTHLFENHRDLLLARNDE